MTGGHPSPGVRLGVRLGVAVLTVAAVAAAGALVVRKVTGAEGVRYTAEFGHAGQGLDTSSPVKIRGVTVGGVTSVDLDDRGRAVLTLRVDPGVRVPDSAAASIEPSSVFGPKFVNLIPGGHEGSGPYLPDGAAITRTEDPADLSDSFGDAYSALSAVNPQEVAVIAHTLGRGLDGKGGELRDLVGNAGTVLDVAYRHRTDAAKFLHDAGDLSTALASKGGDIVGIAADTNAVTPDLVARADEVRAILAELDSISSLTAHGLKKHGGDLRAAVSSGERAVRVVYDQLGIAGDGVRGLTRLLATLNRLIAAPGPDGTRQLGVEAYVLTDPCQLLAGLCDPGGPSPRDEVSGR
ncbi:MCE family protein [Planotetraspora sp. A-T 1434]|uniref:MlaD family protein n=1 Tax=Planotetraspora sp. A-T 1434 TaxID=2979219 RepID=UPI0021BE112B|nr:MlaD family protein [Planotetraspora sp. A-T 1434]MCT9930489.1 MCE family protein [Planotetraspora sp. A-T 1434]